MERMSRELEEMSDSFGQEASENIEKYAEKLRRDIEEMEESINRALEDEDNNLTDKDRRILKEVSASIDKNSESLSEPTAESIAESSKSIGKAQQRLQSVNNALGDEYKRQWRDLSEKFEEDMRKMLGELSASAEAN
jgi:DNA anti-recombination protein RmuC